jgi:hypothetical protein
VKHKFVILLFVGLFVLAGCVRFSADQLAGPQAWIDTPLDGSSLPLAPIEFVAHGSDPAGIARIEFSINDSLVGGVDEASSGVSLETARQPWTPPAAGTYTLAVRAQNRGGAWSGTISVTFRVGEQASPTGAPSATATPTPSPTPAPLFVSVDVTPKIFNHQNANQATCSPNQISLKITVGDPQAVGSVLLFYSLSGAGGTTPWNAGMAMSPLGGGRYAASLAADAIPGAANYVQATLRYQFVANDAANHLLGRSPVYTDVSLGTCP